MYLDLHRTAHTSNQIANQAKGRQKSSHAVIPVHYELGRSSSFLPGCEREEGKAGENAVKHVSVIIT